MINLKIVDGDLVLDGQNNLEMVEDEYETAQSIERTLTTQAGEWFLNPEFGLAYEYIRGKNVDLDRAKLEIVKAITQDDRVETVESVGIEVDRKTRKTKINFACKMKNGDLIQEVIDIE